MPVSRIRTPLIPWLPGCLTCYQNSPGARPGKVHADKAYDSGANRSYLRRREIRPRIARRGVESSVRLGRHRWRIERALSWLSGFRRLQVRWDRDAGRWFAFVLLACAVVCFNRL
jgi:IS5 family transposase